MRLKQSTNRRQRPTNLDRYAVSDRSRDGIADPQAYLKREDLIAS